MDRVRTVYNCLPQLTCPVITVGGTNGKGSTVAFLEAMYLAAGYKTGSYFSPHLWRYNERIRINGREVGDEALCAAFACVERSRASVPLTYFEFGTLAAFVLFGDAGLDVAILEVGLGGRLDAVNVLDPMVAVVVSVGTDHKDWLGPDREAIGREKAGIFRAGRPAVVGFEVSDSVAEEAVRVGAVMRLGGRDFRYTADSHQWRYVSERATRDLPFPVLRGRYQLANAACAIAAVEALDVLSVSAGAVRQGLQDVRLAGRFQSLPGIPRVVLDVAHNEEAAQVLAQTLKEQPVSGRTFAVAGLLKDKPIAGIFAMLSGSFDGWFLASLDDLRGTSAAFLESVLLDLKVQSPASIYPDPVAAFQAALAIAQADDRVVVFGSFKTVGAILQFVTAKRDSGGGRAV